jgi:hypothetical protein
LILVVSNTFQWGVPLVEDGVATYMSIFDQPVNSEMGCSLIDICSISVPYVFQELVHADVKNMSVKAVENKNVTVCNTLHVL